MQIAMIGLGRMGANVAKRLARAGIDILAFDRSPDARIAAAQEPRVVAVDSLQALVLALKSARTIWLMLPCGAPTESTLAALQPLLSSGDLVVDGANAYYRDSQRHGEMLARGLRAAASEIGIQTRYRPHCRILATRLRRALLVAGSNS